MNKTTLIAIASFFIVGLLMGSQLRGCKGGGRWGTELIHTDTLIHFLPRTDTLWQTIALTRSVPYRVWGHDTVLLTRTEHIAGHDTTWLTAYRISTDTATYIDSIQDKNEFRAKLYDTLYNNRIIGRSLKWANVSPIEVRTITNTLLKKSALVKVYAGIEAYGGKASGRIDADLAPAASLIFADRYMVDLGYYIFNQQVTAGLKIKIGRH